MKKITIYVLTLLAFSITTSSLEAQKFEPKSVLTKESKTETKKRLYKNVKVNSIYDVKTITLSTYLKELKKPESLPLLLNVLINKILEFPKLDSFYNDINKSKDQNIKEIINLTKDYLSDYNLGIKLTSFSATNIKISLNLGMPLFAYINLDESFFNNILERNKKRPNAKQGSYLFSSVDSAYKYFEKNKNGIYAEDNKIINTWKKTLAKETQKKFDKTSGKTFEALITGYNKYTKEIEITSIKFGTFWILETELKNAISSVYQLYL